MRLPAANEVFIPARHPLWAARNLRLGPGKIKTTALAGDQKSPARAEQRPAAAIIFEPKESAMRIAVLGTSLLLLVTAPAVGWAKGKTVTCEDGSKSKAGRGACSHHGGIAEAKADPPKRSPPKLDAPERKSGRAAGRSAPERRAPRTFEREGEARARCADGTISYSARNTGACSHHGGVQEWLND